MKSIIYFGNNGNGVISLNSVTRALPVGNLEVLLEKLAGSIPPGEDDDLVGLREILIEMYSVDKNDKVILMVDKNWVEDTYMHDTLKYLDSVWDDVDVFIIDPAEDAPYIRIRDGVSMEELEVEDDNDG